MVFAISGEIVCRGYKEKLKEDMDSQYGGGDYEVHLHYMG